MKLKTIALAMLLSAAGGAYASPTMQSCSPMEVAHNGSAGISYNLKCEAGSWALSYRGSVPAGTDSVLANYRLDVTNPDGSNFTQNRSVRLPSPAMLGQALLREAVVLDGGDLALRDCAEFSCTLYRPLGSGDKLAKATITVTPEQKRLSDEAMRLGGELKQRQADFAVQTAKVAALEQQVKDLSAKLDGSGKSLTDAKAALAAAKEQSNADINGLVSSSKADAAKAEFAERFRSGATIADLTAQLNTANSTLEKVRKEFAACAAAHEAAEAAKATADAEVDARGRQVADLQALLTAVTAKLNAAVSSADAQAAALASTQVQAGKGQFANLARSRLKADAASGEVQTLTSKVGELEGKLAAASAKLQDAQTTQASNDVIRAAAAAGRNKQQGEFEAALADAKNSNAELTSAHAAQVSALQSALTEANGKLSASQAQFDACVAQQAGAQAAQKLSSASQGAELDDLRAKLAAAVSQVAEQAKQLTEAQAALTKTQQAGATAAQSGTAESGLAEQLAAAKAERDAAKADVATLTEKLAAVRPELEKMAFERDEMAKRAQKVAKDTLTALDKVQELQEAKAEQDKVLQDTTNKLMEQSTKLQAANLARELAMQAATTANADTDNQHLQNKQLALQLSRTLEQLKSISAERDDLATKLQAGAQVAPAPTSAALPVSGGASVTVDAESQHRITALEQSNATLGKVVDALRAELANQKNSEISTTSATAKHVK
jgi:chromosome segregation ATPase